jgi:hypothetical protein
MSKFSERMGPFIPMLEFLLSASRKNYYRSQMFQWRYNIIQDDWE